MMRVLDKRIFAIRDGLAAASLRDTVDAAAYADGEGAQVRAGMAPLRRRPGAGEPLDAQLVRGDEVTIYARDSNGWVWLQNKRDGYVGYAPENALSDDIEETTHRVIVLRTFVYPEPDMKKPPLLNLPLAAEVTVKDRVGHFSAIGDGEWIWTAHLAPKHDNATDFVAVAEACIGAPYLWGGNTPDGIDCSGLVQTALRLVNHAAPRDSDQQEKSLGSPLPVAAMDQYKRGDLIFWKGHVGIMCDADTLLHANGQHMLVVKEPLKEAIARIAAKNGGPVTSARRIII